MELLHKIAFLAMAGLVVGIVTAAPVMADVDDDDDDDKEKKWGDKKVHDKKKWGVIIHEWLKRIYGEENPTPQTRSEEPVSLIKRTDFVELCGDVPCDSPHGDRYAGSYYCEDDEIIVGGLVKSTQSEPDERWSIHTQNQEFRVSASNYDPGSILVTVIYLHQ